MDLTTWWLGMGLWWWKMEMLELSAPPEVIECSSWQQWHHQSLHHKIMLCSQWQAVFHVSTFDHMWHLSLSNSIHHPWVICSLTHTVSSTSHPKCPSQQLRAHHMGSIQQEQHTTSPSRSILHAPLHRLPGRDQGLYNKQPQPMRTLDAKAKGVRITLHQCRPNSTKTTGEAHNRGGKARTGNAAWPVLPTVQGHAASVGMMWHVWHALGRKINEAIVRGMLTTVKNTK